jgi:hypothetical protein
MTRARTPLQLVKEAKQIARDHHLFVVEKPDAKGIAYLLYRQSHPANTLLGRRRTPSGIRALVCRVANFH